MPSRSLNNLGPRIALAGGFQIKNGIAVESGTGFPVSGTAGTTVKGGKGAPASSIYIDETTGVQFWNEGTVASPYWSPVSFRQRGIVGVSTDGLNAGGRAGSATTASSYDAGTGVRYFGSGVEENDANTAITLSYPVGGPLLTVGTENQANKVEALGYGHTTALWTPATNGTLVIDATFTAITDILTRTFFLGFSGESAEALVPLVTGATVTMTFSAGGTTGDDVHGLFMDSRLTAASTIFLPTVKSNAAATISTTAAALTVAATMPAAATYTRWRVEIAANGTIYAFVNKVLVKTVASGAATAVALSPAFFQSNTTTTAGLSMGVRRFATYAARA